MRPEIPRPCKDRTRAPILPAVEVLVLGAGAVGLSLAAKLSKVASVRAVARERCATAIAKDGFRLTGIWGDEVFRFPVAPELPESYRCDYAIVASKSRDTAAICRQFAAVLRGAEVVSMQNGVGNEEIIAPYAGRVIGGMIITGFEWRGDAAVHVSVEAGPIKLGRFPEGLDRSVERLAGLFREAGMPVECSPTIRSELWAKTLYNCALNPLGALMGVAYGALADPSSWRIIEGIVREGFDVVHAEGLALPWERPEDYLDYLRSTQLPATAGHHSSMLQDIERGKATEIDFLNGAIASKGERHGIPTPVNSTIVELVRFRESLTSS